MEYATTDYQSTKRQDMNVCDLFVALENRWFKYEIIDNRTLKFYPYQSTIDAKYFVDGCLIIRLLNDGSFVIKTMKNNGLQALLYNNKRTLKGGDRSLKPFKVLLPNTEMLVKFVDAIIEDTKVEWDNFHACDEYVEDNVSLKEWGNGKSYQYLEKIGKAF